MSTGTLYGVGLGPGDPELMTVKAARLISEAPVIAYHSARHGRSIARSVAEPYLREGQIEEKLVYPVTTETTDHPGGYEGAIADFYELSAKRLAEHLDAGRDVVVLCEGDPFFYGSYMYMHERLSGRFAAVVVPGVTSVSAASSVLGRPLVQRDEVLTILPGTLPAPELARRLADTDAAAVLKLGRTFGSVREALAEAGKLDDAFYIERATWGEQRISPLASVDPSTVPYFSLALLPSPAYASRQTPAVSPPVVATGGEVVVVGLGPAGPEWLTPEALSELEAAEHGKQQAADEVAARPLRIAKPVPDRHLTLHKGLLRARAAAARPRSPKVCRVTGSRHPPRRACARPACSRLTPQLSCGGRTGLMVRAERWCWWGPNTTTDGTPSAAAQR